MEKKEKKSIGWNNKSHARDWAFDGNFAAYAFIIHYLPPLNLKVFNSFFKYILISAHNCTEPNRQKSENYKDTGFPQDSGHIL